MQQLGLYLILRSEMSVMAVKMQGQDLFGHISAKDIRISIFISARTQILNVLLIFLFNL